MDVAAHLVELLCERNQTVATCESLTAGLAAATIAGVPGASAVLRGGLVTYATDVKVHLAGVDPTTIETHGVISGYCALEMARGAQRRLDADWAVAFTGVAGPDRQDNHPVGEVWAAIVGPNDIEHYWQVTESSMDLEQAPRVLSGNREAIRRRTVELVLARLAEHVATLPATPFRANRHN